ncbi:hypothetical protein [Myxococcus stipitatus]|uniref:hypothetical protein n=1 Tax=Myxococcus stipitatus TaxID=83455 RepID=UPI0030CEB751
MRKIIFMLVAIPLLSACGGSDDDGGSCGEVAAPETYKGAKKESCAGDPKAKVTCCTYISETCVYSVCELPTACGKWEESAYSCDSN